VDGLSRPNRITPRALILRRAPGGNRPQQGRRTQLILPVSDCGSNASVRVDV
jgi:D-alanyl-D-alanine carboxypeptidase